MGRKPSPIWNHFTKCSTNGNYRTARAKCNHCQATVSGTPVNLKTHLSNCLALPRSIGSMPIASSSISNTNAISGSAMPPSGAGPASSSSVTTPHQTPLPVSQHNGPLSSLRVEVITPHKRRRLDEMLARAMHHTGTPFDFFEHQSWHEFWSIARPAWSPPSSAMISNELLEKENCDIMDTVVKRIEIDKGGIFGMDGATNFLSKSLSSVIVHTPLPFFIEYLRSDLKKESTQNLLSKVKDCVSRINEKVGMQSVYAFTSDSCNGMRDLRRACVNEGLFSWAYGCSTHCLHNLCEDLGKEGDISRVVKKSLLVSKTIKGTSLVRKIFEAISSEKLGRKYAMNLYSKTRWSRVNLMFRRLCLVRPAITYIPYALLHERQERQVDSSFELPPDFAHIITDSSFWTSVSKVTELFNPICKCIGILESDTSTMSLAYACFLYVRVHLEMVDAPSIVIRNYRDSRVLYRWNRIYNPVHALAFYCDPLFSDMRLRICQQYGPEFVGLGKGNILPQCHMALSILAEDGEHYNALMEEFMHYCVSPLPLLNNLQNWHPMLLWGQVVESFPKLSTVLMRVYKAPAPTAGIERNHKIGKRIHTSRRGRTGENKIERQVAVAHNAAQFKRRPLGTRGERFDRVVKSVLATEQNVDGMDTQLETTSNVDGNGDTLDTDEEVSNDEIQLEVMLDEIMNYNEIADIALFNQIDW